MSTESAAAWSEVAAGWERRDAYVSDGMRPVTERLLTELDPRSGETILEVGAGLGEVGRRVAAALGESGHVVVTDQSPAMVEAAARLAAGTPNTEHRVMDAQALDLPDESADGIVSRFAYMLVPDVAAAFSDARRVLRPGGRLVFSVWATPPENPWASTLGRAMVELGHAEPPEPDTPGPFRLADAARLRELVTGAGFGDTRIEDVAVTMRYASFDDYWEITADLAMSLRNALAELPAHAATRLRERVEEGLAQYAAKDGLAVPGRAWVVSADRA